MPGLAAKRGYEVDPTLIGHAEGWIAEHQEPKGFPEEESAEVTAMTLDDIDLFADKTRGNVFFTREHFIVDGDVVTRPNKSVNDRLMPAFFSAVY